MSDTRCSRLGRLFQTNSVNDHFSAADDRPYKSCHRRWKVKVVPDRDMTPSFAQAKELLRIDTSGGVFSFLLTLVPLLVATFTRQRGGRANNRLAQQQRR